MVVGPSDLQGFRADFVSSFVLEFDVDPFIVPAVNSPDLSLELDLIHTFVEGHLNGLSELGSATTLISGAVVGESTTASLAPRSTSFMSKVTGSKHGCGWYTVRVCNDLESFRGFLFNW